VAVLLRKASEAAKAMVAGAATRKVMLRPPGAGGATVKVHQPENPSTWGIDDPSGFFLAIVQRTQQSADPAACGLHFRKCPMIISIL
jgi:hypothetical protein